jgi:hypothetical protein
MALSMDGVGAKYCISMMDANGDFLDGNQNYKLHVPKDVPVALFWSVAVYDPITGSGLDNGQPFPSLNTMDKPAQNEDGTTDIYFGPKSPGVGKNWLATLPGKGWSTIASTARGHRFSTRPGSCRTSRRRTERAALRCLRSGKLNTLEQPVTTDALGREMAFALSM